MKTKYKWAIQRLRTVAKWPITHDKEQLIEAPFKRLQLLSPWEKWGTPAMNASQTCFVFSCENPFFNGLTACWKRSFQHRLGFSSLCRGSESKPDCFKDDETGNSRHVSHQCCPWWLNLVGTRSSHNMSRALLSRSLEWAFFWDVSAPL